MNPQIIWDDPRVLAPKNGSKLQLRPDERSQAGSVLSSSSPPLIKTELWAHRTQCDRLSHHQQRSLL